MISLLPLSVMLPLIGAGLALMIRGSVLGSRIVSISVLGLQLVTEVGMIFAIEETGTMVMHLGGWTAPVGITLVADRLAVILMVTSTIVTLAVLLYAVAQHRDEDRPDGSTAAFHPAMLIMAAGVSNAFVSGDLFNLFVSFEILLTASYVLITLGGTGERIRAGAPYMVVSLLSSVIFLAAIALVYAVTGTVNLADLALRLDGVAGPVADVLHALLLVAFGIKAAVWPMSAWLPDSYPSAPAPVTAVFAGLLTKVGIYAIIRVETLLFPSGRFDTILMWASLATLLIGILGAVAQHDIKRMLSFTLVSHIGYLLFGVALMSQAALAATVYYVVHHILVQTCLFLAAGMVEHLRGTTDVARLGSLARAAPSLAILFFISAMNLGGIPPFSGFLGKVGLFRAGLEHGGSVAAIVVAGGTLTSLITLYTLMRVWGRAFWRPTPPVTQDVSAAELAAEQAAEAAVAAVTSVDGRSEPVHPGAPTVAEAATHRIRIRSAGVPRGMTAATAAVVAAAVMLTVAAGPLYGLADRTGAEIRTSNNYITAVLGEP